MLYLNYKLNEIINKFLLTGDKFLREMHLRQPGFTYSACGPFTKHRERIKKFEETGDTRYIYKNDLNKACFQHDSAYADSKDLVKRTQSDKILRHKTFNIASNPVMMVIKGDWQVWCINFSIKGLWVVASVEKIWN